MKDVWGQPFGSDGQRGASLVEFLIAAPVLALIVFVAMDLNERLEQRQQVAIASRNVAYLDVTAQSGAAAAQWQAAAARTMTPFMQAHGVARDTTAAVVDSVGHAPALGFAAGRSATALSGSADRGYERLSGVVGAGGALANGALDGVSKFVNIFGFGAWILPPPLVRAATSRTTAAGQSSVIQQSIATTAAMTEGRQLSESQALTAAVTARDDSGLHYVRPETAYHPHAYHLQGITGFLFGFTGEGTNWSSKQDQTSGSAESYNAHCMMNFAQGGDSCTNANVNFLAIRALGIAIRVGLTIASFTPAAPAAIAASVAMAVVKEIAITAAKKVVDMAATAIMDKIEEKAAAALEDLGIPAIEDLFGDDAFAAAAGLLGGGGPMSFDGLSSLSGGGGP